MQYASKLRLFKQPSQSPNGHSFAMNRQREEREDCQDQNTAPTKPRVYQRLTGMPWQHWKPWLALTGGPASEPRFWVQLTTEMLLSIGCEAKL